MCTSVCLFAPGHCSDVLPPTPHPWKNKNSAYTEEMNVFVQRIHFIYRQRLNLIQTHLASHRILSEHICEMLTDNVF